MMRFEDVRAFALSLPEVYEKPCYGTPAFRVGKKLFRGYSRTRSAWYLFVQSYIAML
jgi:hypothetical protein